MTLYAFIVCKYLKCLYLVSVLFNVIYNFISIYYSDIYVKQNTGTGTGTAAAEVHY